MPWTVEFYKTERGESPVREFLASLPEKARVKCWSYIELLRQQGNRLSAQYARKVEDELWELRPELGGIEYRFFYSTLVGDRIVILHAISKKTQKLRRADIELALGRMREMQAREGMND